MDDPESRNKLPVKARLGVAVGGVVLVGLFSLLFGYLCDQTFGHDVWTRFVLENFTLVLGLPMAAALAFGVVIAFQETTSGPLEVRLGPLEIKGPAGPILLWVVCLLAIVFSMEYLAAETSIALSPPPAPPA